MRNYKLNLTNMEFGILGNKEYTFTKVQVQQLEVLGWKYDSLFRQFRKTLLPFLEAVLDINKERLYFYQSRFFTPLELEFVITDKNEIKKVRAEIKKLKDIAVLK